MSQRDNGAAARKTHPPRRRHTAKEHGPDPIDLHVGRQLKLARELAGLTQTEVGRALDMSFQVIQKYEQGEIRISASRLFQLAGLFAKPSDYFFEGLAASDMPSIGTLDRADIELVRAFRTIRSPEIRQLLVRLARDIVQTNGVTSGAAAKYLFYNIFFSIRRRIMANS
ncbi:MAG TPA: helix-turn-helix transcriptional regulator [Stellaceae bacterium]|jgi:transcriptional regulator with XRE-family HTH domain